MDFLKHSELKGLHASFSPSKPAWVNYDNDKSFEMYVKSWIATVGTVAHSYAENCIRNNIRLSKGDKKSFKIYLLDNATQKIPSIIVDSLDLDFIFLNLIPYVNDAIGFNMKPEVILKYSDLFFGTADTISFINNFLHIHDLKTGTKPVHIEQLMIYAALFCLEYKYKPNELKGIELRIYQSSEVSVFTPSPDDILHIMDKIITMNEYMTKRLGE